MRPNDDLAPAAIEMSQERLNGPRHMLVAQIPRGSAPLKHGAIITFRVRDQARVLFRIEELRAGLLAIPADDFARTFPQLHELSDHCVFARLAHSRFGG